MYIYIILMSIVLEHYCSVVSDDERESLSRNACPCDMIVLTIPCTSPYLLQR